MKYYFSSPDSKRSLLKSLGVKNYLLSFAVDAKSCGHFDHEDNTVIIDSGAFSVWNKGGTIDIDQYRDFCLKQNPNWIFISLDVIPKTGGGKAENERCCQEGFENYLYLKQHIKNLMPVYHYGDDIRWLKKYMEHTDYIGASPANDTHENIKRSFLDTCFRVTRDQTKLHGLGYSSFEGLYLYPFYSVDSISYKRLMAIVDGYKRSFLTCSQLDYIQVKRVEEFLELEKSVTKYWESKGIVWK
jgi:hypothetical protein